MAKTDRQAEFDRMMVAALGTLLNKCGSRSGKIKTRAWAVLDQDPALSSFFRSVNEAGEDAWNEERMRIGRRFAQRTEGLPAEIRRDMSKDGAVKSLLPTWRDWGNLLIRHHLSDLIIIRI